MSFERFNKRMVEHSSPMPPPHGAGALAVAVIGTETKGSVLGEISKYISARIDW